MSIRKAKKGYKYSRRHCDHLRGALAYLCGTLTYQIAKETYRCNSRIASVRLDKC